MADHTDSPWQLLPEEPGVPYIRIRGTQLGRRYKIANVLIPVYDGADKYEMRETRANARVLVAAPELAKALEELIQAIEFTPLGVRAIKAMTKARGVLAKVHREESPHGSA